MSLSSVEVPGSAHPERGEGGIRRCALPFGPELTVDGRRTLNEVFEHTALSYPNNPCVGYRPIKPDGTALDYVWMTYGEVFKRCKNFGHGIAHLDLCPANEDGLKCLGFYAKNRLEWIIGEQGCYQKSVIPVPLYDTLGAESVEYVVRQTSLKGIVCSEDEADRVFQVAAVEPGILSTAIIMDYPVGSLSADKLNQLKNAGDEVGVKVYTVSQVEEFGAKNPSPDLLPTGSDIAFFCYTSGTTGDPKGALITHQGLISCLVAIKRLGTEFNTNDVYLSYLPLPHVFERGMIMGAFDGGARVGFYQGDTLKILEDLQLLRPTVFASVPRMLNRIYDKILAGVDEAGGIKKWMFDKALSSKVQGLREGHLTHGLWDRLVFGPLKTRLGFDRVRTMSTGSAPIAGHVLDFLRAVFACPVVEGYGQTESSLLISVGTPMDFSYGHVGIPAPCTEVRLIDVSEMGYKSTDTSHSDGTPCMGRGEIIFRGVNVFKGYYKMPDKTEETIDSDGWCYTGDIGLWTPEGKLRIIDRKKNIFKLSQGEYVAAEKIENVIARDPLILMSFVYGDSLQSQLVAVIVPDPETLQARGMKAEDPATMQAIMDAIKTQSKIGDLKGFEYVKAVHVDPNPFSVENGMMTPTFKLKRNIAKDYYLPQIEALYSQLNSSTQSKL